MTPTPTPAPSAPPRLTFRHWPPFEPVDSFSGYVAVTERLSKKKSIQFTYAFRLLPRAAGSPFVAVHFFKQGESLPRELRVYGEGYRCSCDSGKYRPDSKCRHALAYEWLRSQGVI